MRTRDTGGVVSDAGRANHFCQLLHERSGAARVDECSGTPEWRSTLALSLAASDPALKAFLGRYAGRFGFHSSLPSPQSPALAGRNAICLYRAIDGARGAPCADGSWCIPAYYPLRFVLRSPGFCCRVTGPKTLWTSGNQFGFGVSGISSAVFSAAWVSRCLDPSTTAVAASAMLVALSQGMGARATSGRLDTVTVAFELLCLAFTLRALRAQESNLLTSQRLQARVFFAHSPL